MEKSKQLATLNIITYAQIITLVLFSSLILFLKNTGDIVDDEGLAHLFIYVIPPFVVASLTGAYFVFNAMVSKINSALSLKEKLAKYQVAYMTRMAFLEVSGLLGAVAAFVSGQLYFLSAPLLMILVFFLLRPTAQAITEDLKLSVEERELLKKF